MLLNEGVYYDAEVLYVFLEGLLVVDFTDLSAEDLNEA